MTTLELIFLRTNPFWVAIKGESEFQVVVVVLPFIVINSDVAFFSKYILTVHTYS